MKSTVYCTPTDKGIHTFYLVTEGYEYYLFRQNYRKGVNEFFRDGVDLDRALDFTRARHDEAVIRTMSKLPMYIKYIEKFLNPTDIPYVKDKNSAKLYQEYSISAIKKMGANVEETEDSTKQLRKYRIVY